MGKIQVRSKADADTSRLMQFHMINDVVVCFGDANCKTFQYDTFLNPKPETVGNCIDRASSRECTIESGPPDWQIP